MKKSILAGLVILVLLAVAGCRSTAIGIATPVASPAVSTASTPADAPASSSPAVSTASPPADAPASSPADAPASSPADAPASTPAASTACVVSVNAPQCQSTAPDLTVDWVSESDTSGCTFTWSINWGDGSAAQQFTVDGQQEAGEYFFADHTYKATQTRTYSITASDVSVTGGCTSGPGNYTFILGVAGTSTLAALGDSYSAGNGTPHASGVCDRSPQAWPELVPGMVGGNAISASVALLACSGAESNGSGAGDLPAQIAQLRGIKPAPSLVTVTIGGDDGKSKGVGFRNVLLACAVSDAACAVATETELSWIVDDEPALLRQDFSAIKAADPSAILLAVGYPQIFPDNQGCLVFDKAEVPVLNDLAVTLDAAIASAAAQVPGVEYVNASSAFSGHELCSAVPWVLSPLAFEPNTGLHDWLHPNMDGQNAIANVVAEFIESNHLTTG